MKNDCTVRKNAFPLLLILVIIALFPSCQDKKEPQIPIRVSFYDGPKLIETKEAMPDSDILLPDPPEKSGYVFSGWSLDGKMISQQIKDEVRAEALKYTEQGKKVTLAVIQVGADPASSVYVGNKKKACEYIGVRSLAYELPEETTQKELM